MNVVDIVKKTLAFGIGAASFSAEKIKQFADEMVARGEMSSDEAKKFVDEMSERADDEKIKFRDWMNEQMVKMLKQMGAVEAVQFEALERRVALLEAKLAIKSEVAETAEDITKSPDEPYATD